MGWGCIQAANLVAELPFDDTAWIYTDGSSGDGGHGSAFALGKKSVTSSAARHPHPLQGAPSNGPWQWR